jgi:hypothetical protein
MLGDRSAVVLEVRPVEIHGSRFVDVTVRLDDGTRISSRIGQESAPEGLSNGDAVVVSTALNMIVAIRLADPTDL